VGEAALTDASAAANTALRDERELGRVGAFSDAVFAIAITLLVLNIAVPHVPDAELRAAISRLKDDFIAYWIGFAVIGLFWNGNRELFSRLSRVTTPVILSNMGLLALIALMPFTSAVIGRYHTSLAVAIYAANVGLASFFAGLTEVLAGHAGLQIGVPASRWREEIAGSLIRTFVFLLSIPLAYLVSPRFALWSWLFILPLGALANRLAD
jgi:uncharacterized membrane protein